MNLPLVTNGAYFNQQSDIPSLAGKVVLVTGGSVGLGKQSALEFAKHNPSQIWLTARDLNKAKSAVDDIEKQVPDAVIKVLELDLASLESVKNAAKTFLTSSHRLDILMLNAGIMGHPPGLTQEGYEIHFGTNYVGHALLVKTLMGLLLKTASSDPDADVRVICLSSNAHSITAVGGIQFDTLKTKTETMGQLMRYGQSKLANILFSRELAKHYPQLTVASVHPGIVNTNLSAIMAKENLFIQVARFLATPFLASVEKGVRNQVWASTSRNIVSGEYYEPVGVVGKGSVYTRDVKLAERLWDWTEKELENHTI